jgi:hypothetical protein
MTSKRALNAHICSISQKLSLALKLCYGHPIRSRVTIKWPVHPPITNSVNKQYTHKRYTLHLLIIPNIERAHDEDIVPRDPTVDCIITPLST